MLIDLFRLVLTTYFREHIVLTYDNLKLNNLSFIEGVLNKKTL